MVDAVTDPANRRAPADRSRRLSGHCHRPRPCGRAFRAGPGIRRHPQRDRGRARTLRDGGGEIPAPIRKLNQGRGPAGIGGDLDSLDAHLAILGGSRLIRGERRITEDRFNAEYAVQTEVSSIAQHFAAMDDAYLAGRIQDIRDVGARLIRNLSDRKYQARHPAGRHHHHRRGDHPSDTALMDPAGGRLRHHAGRR